VLSPPALAHVGGLGGARIALLRHAGVARASLGERIGRADRRVRLARRPELRVAVIAIGAVLTTLAATVTVLIPAFLRRAAAQHGELRTQCDRSETTHPIRETKRHARRSYGAAAALGKADPEQKCEPACVRDRRTCG